MQLPRGNFHSLKKDFSVRSLLTELTDSGFTGHCSIVIDNTETASLVFEKGVCMLADAPPRQGMAALEQLKEMGDSVVNAELYSLTPDQIILSREFNQKCLVQNPPSAPPRDRTPGIPSNTPGSPPEFRKQNEPGGSRRKDSGRGTIQLPRGKFHSLVKDTTLSVLLDTLKNERFSGYGSIAIGEESGHLVLEEGLCLLASFPPERGSAALQVLQTMIDEEVSAELYLLTPSQMQLSLEFNRSYRVSVATNGVPVRMKLQKINEKPLKTERGAASAEPPVDEDFEEQIRVLESMDLKAMEDQFRHSLTDVLDRLQMNYLIPEEGDQTEPTEAKEETGDKHD
jgi:hypothetical protein